MTTKAKIKCFNCNNTYEVYKSEVRKEHIVHCPYCDAKMDNRMWEAIIRAIYTVGEVNYLFRKYHQEREEDLFQVDIEQIYVPYEKYRIE
ncbi:MAG: hypothetical protein E6590_12825 [Clostridiales bacterium]|uniref:hypothetical protein n=1 Tax=Clostridium sp. TaxID=1506 RepID=UPI002910D278|nr:hypothetical protein [Clostridium sp.]MDU6274034.1 hypothetical protein [Clostridium sp.]MDU6360835.1 hypothetical protein [Clostridiales bacterium]